MLRAVGSESQAPQASFEEDFSQKMQLVERSSPGVQDTAGQVHAARAGVLLPDRAVQTNKKLSKEEFIDGLESRCVTLNREEDQKGSGFFFKVWENDEGVPFLLKLKIGRASS